MADARLLHGEHVLIDEVSVTELEQSLLFLLERVKPLAGPLYLLLGRAQLGVGVVLDGGAYAVLLVVGDPAPVVVVALDRGFDGLGPEVGCVAAVAQVMASEAAEVLVASAVALDWRVGQASAAAAAEDRSLEVVLVLLRAVAAKSVRAQNLLYSLEDLRVDERRMLALDGCAVVAHEPDVVRVAKHAVNGTAREWRRRALGGHRRLEAGGVEHLRDCADGVLARGVATEGHLNHGCSLGIELDGANVPTELALAHVEVADWCPAGRASHGVLSLEAHADLLGVACRPELVDRGEHAVCQAPAGGLVDVLQDGDELGAARLDLEHELRVVETVAR